MSKKRVDTQTDNEILNMQRMRLGIVIDYLNKQGIKQKHIANKTDDMTTYDISHLRNGETKYIPQKFLEFLKKEFNINPEYIRGTSDIMLNIQDTYLANFEKIVYNWSTVEKSNNRYLHFEMDKNFYEFLLEVDKAKLMANDGIGSFEEEIQHLKSLYTGKPDLQEYILIPRNNFIEYVSEAIVTKKQLEDLINLGIMTDYLEEN